MISAGGRPNPRGGRTMTWLEAVAALVALTAAGVLVLVGVRFLARFGRSL